ncbi:hypothetical protein ACSBR1_027427 [Camellia fascicularis]
MEGGEGWKRVFRQRIGRYGPSSNMHTIFADEIPESMNPKELYVMFSNFGVVKDVYIPDKRRKATKSRFRFVRYDCPVAAGIAIQKTDGTWCDNKVLKRFEAPTRTRVEGKQRRRSYADVLQGRIEGGGNDIKIKAEDFGNGWLYESVIVKLNTHCNFTEFKKELPNRGLKDLHVREGGELESKSIYPIQVVEESNPEESYKCRDDQSSANCHGNNNEDDDMDDMEAGMEDYGDMAIGKRTIDRKKGTVDGHNCNSATVSMVNKTGAEVGTLNSAEKLQ